MFGRKAPMLSAVISSMLGGVNIETLFAHQLADKNGWYFVGVENDYFKFHDVINDKEITLTVAECMRLALKEQSQQ